MTKLGSEKNPLILRLADESKVDDIANICDERGWHFILGIEPDEEEDLTDLERKLNPPIPRVTTKIGRNELCSCGSGKKYKNAAGLTLSKLYSLSRIDEGRTRYSQVENY